MPDTTASIRKKGLDNTGVTEEIAARLFTQKGKHIMAIVELKVDETHEKVDGQKRVDLVLTQVEPIEDQRTEDHVRELSRVLYYNRKVDPTQPTLDGTAGDEPNPKIGDVIAGGQALIERDDDGDPVGLWDATTDAEHDVDEEDSDGPAYDDQDDQPDVDDVDLPDVPDHPDVEPSNVVTFSGRS